MVPVLYRTHYTVLVKPTWPQGHPVRLMILQGGMTHRRDPVRRWRRKAAGSGATGRYSVGSATTVCWAPALRNPRSVFTFLKNEYIYRRFKLQLAPACGPPHAVLLVKPTRTQQGHPVRINQS
eukprot:SAG31_NODE_4048_length_3637_cov_23.139062_3_plen_123_part_00